MLILIFNDLVHVLDFKGKFIQKVEIWNLIILFGIHIANIPLRKYLLYLCTFLHESY